MARRRFLVVDACVLIDFAKADTAILPLVSRYVGEVHVATPVFEQVKDLDPAMAASLGIRLYEPSLEMASVAAATKGRLSFQDRLCFAIAKKEGWTCVSDDKQLRAHCESETVLVLWGFEVLAMLVEARALKAVHARDLAKKIAVSNKAHRRGRARPAVRLLEDDEVALDGAHLRLERRHLLGLVSDLRRLDELVERRRCEQRPRVRRRVRV